MPNSLESFSKTDPFAAAVALGDILAFLTGILIGNLVCAAWGFTVKLANSSRKRCVSLPPEAEAETI